MARGIWTQSAGGVRAPEFVIYLDQIVSSESRGIR
jgi:hypothetical protein